METYDRAQELLKAIRDEQCKGNAAELARRIDKDKTYVNRLFYPIGKKARKGIGPEIMKACTKAFGLPPGYWEGLDGLGSGWPFPEIDRERFDRLDDWQRIEIQGLVRNAIKDFEAENKGRPSGEFSDSRPDAKRRAGT